MGKNVIQVKSGSDFELYAKEGYVPGSPAVMVVWGFSTDSETGPHCWTNSFAMAELGRLNEDGDFERIAYTEDNLGAKGQEPRVYSKQVLGMPIECEGWDPNPDKEEDWEVFSIWINDYCRRVL